MRKTVKWILISLGFLLLLFILLYWEAIVYGFNQGKGQLKVIWGAEPIEKVLQRSDTPDSVRYKLQLIQEIREFAIDSLGIKESNNYTTYFDMQGKPILWVVTACEPFALVAKEWDFPLLGTFSYKGFFEEHKALAEKASLDEQDFDTNLGTVSGWSTLGWFKDPVLSSMLSRKEGDLANLIIHELTHLTLYVKDDVTFNENLATFVGDEGARQFLMMRFGKDSGPYQEYIASQEDGEKFARHFIRGAKALDALYSEMDQNMQQDVKLQQKNALIRKIVEETDTLNLHRPERVGTWTEGINNTFFMSYLRYHGDQDQFKKEYEENFGGSMKRFIEFYKKKYPSL